MKDDRVRPALAHAGLREGLAIGGWGVCVSVATAAAPEVLDEAKLMAHAKSREIEARGRETTGEFQAVGVTQRLTFVLENAIGDKAVLSGLAKSVTLITVADAIITDETAQLAYTAHHGPPPP